MPSKKVASRNATNKNKYNKNNQQTSVLHKKLIILQKTEEKLEKLRQSVQRDLDQVDIEWLQFVSLVQSSNEAQQSSDNNSDTSVTALLQCLEDADVINAQTIDLNLPSKQLANSGEGEEFDEASDTEELLSQF